MVYDFWHISGFTQGAHSVAEILEYLFYTATIKICGTLHRAKTRMSMSQQKRQAKQQKDLILKPGEKQHHQSIWNSLY